MNGSDRIDTERIRRVLAEVRGKRLLVVGDVMADEFLFGSVSRVSPEAPVPVLEYGRHTLVPGGAGNAAANAASLGARVSIAGVAGNDDTAADLIASLGKLGIDVTGIQHDPSRHTTRKTRVIAGNQQIVRIDRETRGGIDDSVREAMLGALDRLLPGTDCVLISDYDKGTVARETAEAVMERCLAQGIRVVVDTKKEDPRCFAGAFALTPNKAEAVRMGMVLGGGRVTSTSAEGEGLPALAGLLLEALRVEALLITRAEEGVSVFERAGGVLHLPALASEVRDVTGAGDTVAASVALGVAAGRSLPDSARFANIAAACVVRRLGTAVIGPDELLAFLQSQPGE